MAKLYFYYSTMNAGKSTTLLQSSYNYRERNMNTMVYTAAIDDRFGLGKVTSRIGIHEDANLFTSTSDLFAEVSQRLQQEKIHCVLVDEAQFLTKQQVYQLSDRLFDTLQQKANRCKLKEPISRLIRKRCNQNQYRQRLMASRASLRR